MKKIFQWASFIMIILGIILMESVAVFWGFQVGNGSLGYAIIGAWLLVDGLLIGLPFSEG